MDFNKQQLSWYESWIIEDTSNEDGRAERKLKEARKLGEAIDNRYHDSDTLQKIIQLLDHECLCYGPIHDPSNRPTRALGTNWTSTILDKLSNCLVQAISPSSHFERELQSRALISTLALLRAQDVNAFEAKQYDRLFNQFQSLFQDLRNLQPVFRDGVFTREKFRQFQSSYLLCSAAEYARYFRRAEPIFIAALSRLTDLLYIGASTAIWVNTGIGSVQETVRQLPSVLQPLWLRPNEEYQALFLIQELTRKTVALHFVAKVKEMSERIDENGKAIASAALRSSMNFAVAILDQILVELKSHNDFETTIRRPSSLWQYFLAIRNRRTPAMNTYFYLYGLLDCATQLGRILPYHRIKDEFKRKMMTIICKSEEESYRWKAVEFLLADAKIRPSQFQSITGDLRQEECQQVSISINVLSSCFREEDGLPLLERYNSSSSSQTSDSFDKDTLVSMSPQDWIEGPFDPFAISNEAQVFSIKLEKGEYKSAGFSPECTLAFLLSKNSICVYSFQSLPQVCRVPVKDRIPKDLVYKEAVLSERLLAIITNRDLRVFELMSSNAGYRQVGIEQFCRDLTCLALHEANNRALISVGNRENHNGVIYGSINIYRVDLSDSRPATIVRQIANFNSPSRDGFPKTMNFSPDGLRLACVTYKNRVLTWLLSDRARSGGFPFQIRKRYNQEREDSGVTSARIFYPPSSRPYILSTTSPSNERFRNGGEWTYISPVSDTPSDVPKELDQDLWRLRDARAILTGAVTPNGDVVALLEETGKVLLFPLEPGRHGGLVNFQEPIKLDKELSKQQKASTTSLRFCVKGTNRQLHLYAIDTKGRVVWKSFNQEQLVPWLA